MNTPVTAPRFKILDLARAIDQSHAMDALRCQFSEPNWEILSAYLKPMLASDAEVLFTKGSTDRTLFLVETGALSVHYEDEKGRVRMAIVASGSVVGEGSFFAHQPRNATVQASGNSKLWCLTPLRFSELSNRHSPIALELGLALASVMARRLYNRLKRVAVT
ncbi:MAG: cyclic nucleotide-binding domain-containing protein [Pseudomonadota bacterium]